MVVLVADLDKTVLAVVSVVSGIAALGFLGEVAVAVVGVRGLAQQYALFGEAVVGIVRPIAYGGGAVGLERVLTTG